MLVRWAVAVAFVIQLPAAGAIQPTWAQNVAPLIYKHCSGCHRSGQPAPFPLLSYEDVRRRGALIQSVTHSRFMPPWLPVAGFGDFAGARRLTNSELSLITSWVQGGMPEGDTSLAPPPPIFPDDWALGKPDLVAALKVPYSVPADGPDDYRCFVLPLTIDRERYVRAFEFAPGPGSALHHALIFVDGRRQTLQMPEQYSCFGTPGFFPSAAIGGWTPGNTVRAMPEGTAVHLTKGARLVLQLHFHPTGKIDTIDPHIALYFADQPPSRALMDVALGSNRIDIPAGNRAYIVRDRFQLPVPVEVVGVIPHAHYLCRDMKAWAILPGGRKRWLLWIDHWDFNWQDQYRYAQPFTLPGDTELHIEFTYDNSDANVANPNHPAKRVTWGTASTDEMAGLHLQVIPKNETDMHELGMALWGKVMRGVGGRFFELRSPE